MPTAIVTLGGTGVVQADTAATGGSLALRDGSGNLTINKLTASVASVASLVLGQVLSTTTATASPAAGVLLLNSSSGSYTETLPPVASSAGQLFIVISVGTGSNTATLQGNASENIYHGGTGANTYTGFSAQGKFGLLYCDGTQWWVGLLS